MDALVMCGGRGTRLDASTEKPLFEIGGRPMIERVLSACRASGLESVTAVVSPHAPETRAYLADRSIDLLETPGEGYVSDLGRALEAVDAPVLTVAADLPLLEAEPLDRVLAAHDHGSLTVCVPAVLKELLELSVGHTSERNGQALAPTGLNIVGEAGPDEIHRSYDVRLAVNVNRRSDARIAERLR